jgi:hypothetical protein
VKWLARLDHKNIVRYFHSWIEEEEEESHSSGTSDDWDDSASKGTDSTHDDTGARKAIRSAKPHVPSQRQLELDSDGQLSSRSHSPSGPESTQGHSSNSYWNDITESDDESFKASKEVSADVTEQDWDEDASVSPRGQDASARSKRLSMSFVASVYYLLFLLLLLLLLSLLLSLL